jgi:alkylation response protein AidB-like acyl-CoA dehydrogenase
VSHADAGPHPHPAVATARRIADEMLFPQAAQVDAADAVPRAHLDALAAAGLYGVVGPARAGGLGADLPTLTAVVEALAGGDLATTFVWVQHQGLVLTLAAGGAEDDVTARWLGPLCRGERRAGIAGGGLLPGSPRLRAEPVDGGWLLDGESPWVTGWGLVDVLHVSARTADDHVVQLIVDADEAAGVTVEPQRLTAVNASRTVRLVFDGHLVPASRLIRRHRYDPVSAAGGPALRINGSLSLGLAGRCCRLLGPSGLDEELSACRAALDDADAAGIGPARAAASALALRAAAALVVHEGSGATVAGHHAGRLAREALFLLIFGSRPAIRRALLDELGATARPLAPS